MSTIHQLASLTIRKTYINDGTLAVRTMGARHHGTITNRKTSAKVPNSRNRLFHQMDKGRTTSNDNREEHPKFCLEGSSVPIRDITSTRL